MISPGWQCSRAHNLSSVRVSMLPSPFFIFVNAACEIKLSLLILYVVIPFSFSRAKSLSYLNGIIGNPPIFYFLGSGGIKSPLSYDTHYTLLYSRCQVYTINKYVHESLCTLRIEYSRCLVYNSLARLRKADEIKRKPNQEGHVRAGTDKGD